MTPIDYGSPKSSGSVSESSGSSYGSSSGSDSGSGSGDFGSSSGSESSGSGSGSDFGSVDIGSSSGSKSSGSSSGSDSGSGSGSESPIFYRMEGRIQMMHDSGWTVTPMIEGRRVGYDWVANDGEVSGGLLAYWPSAENNSENTSAYIFGDFSEEADFGYVFHGDASTPTSIFRRLYVTNQGETDIVVNSTTVAPGATIWLLDEVLEGPFDERIFTVFITRA